MRAANVLRRCWVSGRGAEQLAPGATHHRRYESRSSAEAGAGTARSELRVARDVSVLVKQVAADAAQERLAACEVPVAGSFEGGAKHSVAGCGQGQPVGDAGHRSIAGRSDGTQA